LAQAVRVFMQVFERHAFGTEIPAAEDISGVSANAFNAAFGHGNFKAAARFTERADPMVDGFFSRFDHRVPPSGNLPARKVNTSKVMTLAAVVNRLQSGDS